MRLRRAALVLGAAVALLAAAAGEVRAAPAAVIAVAPGEGTLQAALDTAPTGAVLRLAPGLYAGVGYVIDRPLTLEGAPGAILDGGGRGRVLSVAAPDVVVRGLIVRNSGLSLAETRRRYLSRQACFKGSSDRGQPAGEQPVRHLPARRQERAGAGQRGDRQPHPAHERTRQRHPPVGGPGARWWRTTPCATAATASFVTTSRKNAFRNNSFSDLRFALHYMYTHDSEVSGNVSRDNHVGYALMYSDRLRVLANRSTGDRDHGFLFNFTNKSRIEGNLVRDGRTKCVFLYNANRNTISGNLFEGCAIGIHFTAGSEGNVIAGNGVRRQRDAGEVCRHPPRRVVRRRRRQLLERQSRLRPRWRRHRRRALQAQRPRGSGGLAPPAGQAAAHQPVRAHPALGP